MSSDLVVPCSTGCGEMVEVSPVEAEALSIFSNLLQRRGEARIGRTEAKRCWDCERQYQALESNRRADEAREDQRIIDALRRGEIGVGDVPARVMRYRSTEVYAIDRSRREPEPEKPARTTKKKGAFTRTPAATPAAVRNPEEELDS